jgi:hypothetical protein
MSGKLIDKYIAEPLKFVEKRLKIRTWSGMKYIIDTVWKNKRTSIRSAHGIGKTFVAALIAVMFLNLYENSIVISTAPVNRQVKDLLWKEINALYNRTGNFLLGERVELRIKIAPEWYMVGFATDRAVNVEGYHSPNILWVLDEAKGMEPWIYDSIEGSMTGGNSKILEISTTDGADQQTPFYRHHTKERTQWKTIHLSAFDSPFVHPNFHKEISKNHICKELYEYGKPKNKREWSEELKKKIQIVDENWIEDKINTWKIVRKDLWETKVLGNLSGIGMYNAIPLAWVESAVNAEVEISSNEVTYGLDIGAGGDPSALVKKVDKKVVLVYAWIDENTMGTTGEVVRIRDTGIVRIDMIGVGNGPFHRLAELGIPVIGVDSRNSPAPSKVQEFTNLRAQMWFDLRRLFERQYYEGNVLSIPDDEELIEELTAVKYKPISNGKIKIEEKEEVKKRIGRSTNKADALVYCCADLREILEI